MQDNEYADTSIFKQKIPIHKKGIFVHNKTRAKEQTQISLKASEISFAENKNIYDLKNRRK